MPNHFCIIYDSFHVAVAQLNSCDSHPCKAYNIDFLALYRQGLPVSVKGGTSMFMFPLWQKF